MSTVPTTPNDPPVFYTLPAELIGEGMSTADGQDVLADADERDGLVCYDVYTPADDPDENAERQCSPEGRAKPVGERVDMATFWNTTTDGSVLPQAVIDTPVA